MPRHRVDLGLGGMGYSVDGQFVDATGFPLWQRELPRGLHLESRTGGSRNDNRQFVRTSGFGVSVEWTSSRDNRDAAPRREEGPPPRQPRGPPPGHHRGPPPGYQQGPPPEHVRAHHAGQRRAQHPERRRREQRGREPGSDPQFFDVSEYDSEDDEDGDEGSRASLRRDNYGFADDPYWHGHRNESEWATWASGLECDSYASSAHNARSRTWPRQDDRRSAHDPHWCGFRVQLRQPSRGRGH